MGKKEGITIKLRTRLVGPVAMIVLLYSMFCRGAYAYIDPGTGSLIIQFVIAALLGGLLMIRVKIKSLLKRLFSRGEKREEAEE
jgi:hypothetical protein